MFQPITRSWPSTRGQLNHLGLDKFGSAIIISAQDYHAEVLYTYQIERNIYRGKRVSPKIIIASHNIQFILRHQLSKVETYPDNEVQVFCKSSNPCQKLAYFTESVRHRHDCSNHCISSI
ncbi:hypothetical protein [Paraglaciecola psychrophila]|uniref:Uncharacterized protein n=1 Tax=Paraglaciecola psychrophila 170 TaxID=1129794 RepID=K7AI41_9ALTE|nr:hypothetical protein [Paraglaciecola psychrophila]AGH46977.1 hypothetical protein C427_4878 [Paraglaciecola psychrophila 170]GAC40268.1 hypothetical protein GPSY_4665 [Paraglaciecola psychrophila 170]